MLTKRLLFVIVGAVIAGLAVSLILNALRSDTAGSSDAITDSAADSTPESGGASGVKSRQWQEFTGGTAHNSYQVTADLRPIERLAHTAGRPFDQAYARGQLNRLGFRLEGVGRGAQPLALISGRVLRIGDRIEGYRVESIERSGVLLIGPNGMRIDLAPKERSASLEQSAAQVNLSAGNNGYGGGNRDGQQNSVWRSEDGLRARPYFPDGKPDIRPTDPNLKVKEILKNENLPWDRATPWPRGPFPHAPAAYIERERNEQKKQRNER